MTYTVKGVYAMQKIRFTQKCAGGCGEWLVVGRYAVKMHRGFWCLVCADRHSETCLSVRHREPAPLRSDRRQLALW